jgi:HJR/Mrr/RecB family endonuclease
MTDNSHQDNVTAAEASLKAAEARLATALADASRLASESTVARLVTNAWGASWKVRQALDRLEVPRVIPVALIPLPVTFLGFVFIVESTGLGRLGATGAVIVFTAATVIATFLCFFPGDEAVKRECLHAEARLQHISNSSAASQRHVLTLRADVSAASERLVAARNTLIATQLAEAEQEQQVKHVEKEKRQSLEYKFQKLYLRPWRAMRAGEFEAYLAEVLTTHGYGVQETGQSGDQGVDLIATKQGWRIAIQAKGYSGSVGNAAVQEVFAGMAHYGCHSCVVITNSTYTNGAVSLANSTRCLLIHEENFREFVFGQLALIAEAVESAVAKEHDARPFQT